MLLSILFFAILSVSSAHPIGRRHKHIRRACPHGSPAVAPQASATQEAIVASSSHALSSSFSASAAVSATSSAVSATSSTVSAASSAGSPASTQAQAAPPSSIAGLIKALFPVSQTAESWTTVAGVAGSLPLADSTFKPFKEISALAPQYVQSPGSDSKLSMKVTYNQGSFKLDNSDLGGISFYAPGPDNVDLTTAKEATFGYSVMFEEGFEFNMGGKLPGLCESCRPVLARDS